MKTVKTLAVAFALALAVLGGAVAVSALSGTSAVACPGNDGCD